MWAEVPAGCQTAYLPLDLPTPRTPSTAATPRYSGWCSVQTPSSWVVHLTVDTSRLVQTVVLKECCPSHPSLKRQSAVSVLAGQRCDAAPTRGTVVVLIVSEHDFAVVIASYEPVVARVNNESQEQGGGVKGYG